MNQVPTKEKGHVRKGNETEYCFQAVAALYKHIFNKVFYMISKLVNQCKNKVI